MMRSIRLLGSLSLGAGLVFTAACGSKPKNKNLPKAPADLSPADAATDVAARDAKWNDLLTALAVPASFALPSTLITGAATDAAVAAKYQTLIGTITKKYLASANATRCAAIVGAQSLGFAKVIDDKTGVASDLTSANLYIMKYKLQKDATGAAEDATRAALVTIPTVGTQNAPILAYAHGSEAGLSVGELATIFGQLQGSFIVGAPTYPGEPLCAGDLDYVKHTCVDTPLVAAEGTVSPFDTDVDELLGVQNCLVRASLPVASGGLTATVIGTDGVATGEAFETLVQTHVQRIGGTGSYASLPQSVVAGSSRGGLVAGLAISKTGAALSALASNASALGTAYGAPSFFSCGALNFAPESLTFGEYRVMFESLVKGTVENTAFVDLPMVRKLETLLKPYRDGTETLDQAVLDVTSRDLSFTAPLMIAALRNWSKFDASATTPTGKGAIGYFHGVLDKIVPYNQTLIGGTVFATASKSAAILTQAKAPGVDVYARGFMPIADYLVPGAATPTLLPGYYQHGDAAYTTAKSVLVQTAADQPGLGDDQTSALGVTPAQVIGTWLTTGACLTARAAN